MKPRNLSSALLAAAVLSTAGLQAQQFESPPAGQASPADNPVPEVPLAETEPVITEPPAIDEPPAVPAGPQPGDIVPPPPGTPGQPDEAGAASFGPLEEQNQAMENNKEGYLIKDANINDIFQYLARQAGRQYFHNQQIATQEYRVTGHLNDGDPLQQMEELAFMYNLTIYTKGTTLYAMTQAQLSQLPSIEFNYRLRYLRPTDIAQINELIKPNLSASGLVTFEPKTNTIIVIDKPQRIEAVRRTLHDVDRERPQIVVETKILRINSTAAQRTGVDWTSTLGTNGINLQAVRSLNSVFGLPSQWDTISVPAGSSTDAPLATNNLVLSPIELTAVLRALAEGGLSRQVSNPTLITEDNEQATISIIDRVPIVTATTSAGTGTSTATEEVRYKIDDSDKSIDADPENHREIGISIVVTPTLLPDGTVRMKLRPRSAQVTSEIRSALSGNLYPRVTESMVESLARVPDGHSLVVGGFYGEMTKDAKTKVPILGDVPVLNFFFKSKENTREQTSLVFIVTPTSYNPQSHLANATQGGKIRQKSSLTPDHDWVDELNPGPAHDPNFARGMRDLQPYQAPYYPRTTTTTTTTQVVEDTKGGPPSKESSKPHFSRARR